MLPRLGPPPSALHGRRRQSTPPPHSALHPPSASPAPLEDVWPRSGKIFGALGGPHRRWVAARGGLGGAGWRWVVSKGRWGLGAPEGEVARLLEGGSEVLGGVHSSEVAGGGDGEVGGVGAAPIAEAPVDEVSL